MTGSRKLLAWLVPTVAAFVVLLAWALPDAIEHRGQIHAVTTQVVVCTTEHGSTGRTQTLLHLADCAGDNTEVRRELRDELCAVFLLAVTIAGTSQLARRT
jgi:hypothetical protein